MVEIYDGRLTANWSHSSLILNSLDSCRLPAAVAYSINIGARQDGLRDHEPNCICRFHIPQDCGAPAGPSDFAARVIRQSLVFNQDALTSR
jgi:hypothetical protein